MALIRHPNHFFFLFVWLVGDALLAVFRVLYSASDLCSVPEKDVLLIRTALFMRFLISYLDRLLLSPDTHYVSIGLHGCLITQHGFELNNRPACAEKVNILQHEHEKETDH